VHRRPALIGPSGVGLHIGAAVLHATLAPGRGGVEWGPQTGDSTARPQAVVEPRPWRPCSARGGGGLGPEAGSGAAGTLRRRRDEETDAFRGPNHNLAGPGTAAVDPGDGPIELPRRAVGLCRCSTVGPTHANREPLKKSSRPSPPGAGPTASAPDKSQGGVEAKPTQKGAARYQTPNLRRRPRRGLHFRPEPN